MAARGARVSQLNPRRTFLPPSSGGWSAAELLSHSGSQNLPARGSEATAVTGGVTEMCTRDFGK